MISDSLLLCDRDRPLSSQPFTGCCDTLVAKRKTISIAVAEIIEDLKNGADQKLCKHLAELAEGVSVATETTAQLIYVVSTF